MREYDAEVFLQPQTGKKALSAKSPIHRVEEHLARQAFAEENELGEQPNMFKFRDKFYRVEDSNGTVKVFDQSNVEIVFPNRIKFSSITQDTNGWLIGTIDKRLFLIDPELIAVQGPYQTISTEQNVLIGRTMAGGQLNAFLINHDLSIANSVLAGDMNIYGENIVFTNGVVIPISSYLEYQ